MDFSEKNSSDQVSSTFAGHKIILAARSEYFRALLYGGLSETNKKEISLKVPLKAFKNIILKYVYTGKANLGQYSTPQMNLILDTLGLANLFSYTELKDEIAMFLKSSLNVSSGSLRSIASSHGMIKF